MGMLVVVCETMPFLRTAAPITFPIDSLQIWIGGVGQEGLPK